MKKAQIFLIGDRERQLVEMEETPYPSEDTLQQLLANHPKLLPGDQLDPEHPRRWLLVGREIGVPAGEEEGDWWSVDHLFLDQDAVPTFVECKRASDTRSRREVVAQMLDYAANAIAYWPVDRIRQKAAETAESSNRSLDETLAGLCFPESDLDIEGYWDQVESNLRSGRVRLVFALDEAPRELRRLVEFLNEKMSDVEVVAVEFKRFKGGGSSVVVPRLIGQTEAARDKKTTGPKRKTTKSQFLASCNEPARNFFERILDDAEGQGLTVYWGEVGCSIRAPVGPDGGIASIVYLFPSREFQLYFGHLGLGGEETQKLRGEFREFGNLQESGNYTLKVDVTKKNIARIRKTYKHMMEKVEEWKLARAEQTG